MRSDYDHNHWMDGHMNGSMGWGGWLVMGIVLFICLAILVALVVWVARTSSSSSGPTGAHSATPVPRASAILDERFARGETDGGWTEISRTSDHRTPSSSSPIRGSATSQSGDIA